MRPALAYAGDDFQQAFRDVWLMPYAVVPWLSVQNLKDSNPKQKRPEEDRHAGAHDGG